MKSFKDLASDPHQYDSLQLDWNKEGKVDSSSRKYFNYYLSPKLEVKDLSVLDIGCGLGQLFPVLEAKGAKEIVGIEPSNKNVAFTKEKYPQHQVVQSTLENYSPDRKFDIATSIMVFEHIPDVPVAFKYINNLLNKGGIFYMIVSDKDYSLRPRFDYKIEVEEQSEGVVVTKTQRNWGVLYDICRPVEYYIKYALQSGFSLVEHVPISPNEDSIKFMPHYKDYLGVNTSHLLIFKAN